MNIAKMLFNAASGGVLGNVLHCVIAHFDTKNTVLLLRANIDAAERGHLLVAAEHLVAQILAAVVVGAWEPMPVETGAQAS